MYIFVSYLLYLGKAISKYWRMAKKANYSYWIILIYLNSEQGMNISFKSLYPTDRGHIRLR